MGPGFFEGVNKLQLISYPFLSKNEGRARSVCEGMRYALLFVLLLPALSLAADDIVFREDFEHFNRKNWDDISDKAQAIDIVDGGHQGKCLQITAKRGQNTGGHLFKLIQPGLDQAYVRFYVKFDKEHGYIHHFFHVCAYNPPTRYPQGGAGDKPRGDERFTTGIEPWGFWGKYPAPGAWNLYSYWCEMKGSRDGKYWGNSFAPDPPVQVVRDKWICMELMIKCNSAPDKADGEQALWIDGKEVGHWKGIRWRTDPKLKIDGLWVLDYITETADNQNGVKNPDVNRVWFDDIVVSKSYVGPTIGQ
jgi:hypothetical protein